MSFEYMSILHVTKCRMRPSCVQMMVMKSKYTIIITVLQNILLLNILNFIFTF